MAFEISAFILLYYQMFMNEMRVVHIKREMNEMRVVHERNESSSMWTDVRLAT